MNEPKTITDLKAAFIRAQVRQLSTALSPSPAWRSEAATKNDGTDEEAEQSLQVISDKAVGEIIEKLNAKLKSHNRLVFSAQSQRHVAEQIDALYWNEVSAENLKLEADTTWVRRNTDLCETDAIVGLPEKYKDLHLHDGHQVLKANVQKYEGLRNQLGDLARKRDEQKQKLELYGHLNDLLGPFENARENVQPNLVTKDGELSKELEKMKALIARVVGRMEERGQLLVKDTNVDIRTNEIKLKHVLDSR